MRHASFPSHDMDMGIDVDMDVITDMEAHLGRIGSKGSLPSDASGG